MHKNILITGATGVLAKKLIKKFSENSDYNVFASTRNIQNPEVKYPNAIYMNNDDLITKDCLNDIDIILHCAFPKENTPKTLTEAIQFYDNILIKAIENNIKGIINISSQSVYGDYREYPSNEWSDIAPSNNYAMTKYFCELLGCSNVKNSNTKLVNIRLASLIGVDYPERVINKIISNLLNKHEIVINNDKNVFGYLDVDDAVSALYIFISSTDLNNWHSIYNLGQTYEESKNFEYIANCISELCKERNIQINTRIEKKDKADKLCMINSEDFYKTANWKPQITLKKAIEKIFKYYIF